MRREDDVEAAVAESVGRLARRPARRAGPRRGGNGEAEPRGLLGVGAGRRIAERGAGLGQPIEGPAGQPAIRADFEHPQGPPLRPARGDLAERLANQLDPGAADRRAVQQMLDHRQPARLRGAGRRRAGPAAPRGGGDQREFGNQFRLLRQAAGARLPATAGRSLLRWIVQTRSACDAAPKRSQQAEQGPRTAARRRRDRAVLDDLVDRERDFGIDDAQQRLEAQPRRSARPAAISVRLARRPRLREWRPAA